MEGRADSEYNMLIINGVCDKTGDPEGSRTPVAGLKTRCPNH